MKRRKMTKTASRKLFKKGSNIHRVNKTKLSFRGGTRL